MSLKYKLISILIALSLFVIFPLISYFLSHIFYFLYDIFIHYLNFLSLYFDPISCWFIAVVSAIFAFSIICAVLFGDIGES